MSRPEMTSGQVAGLCSFMPSPHQVPQCHQYRHPDVPFDKADSRRDDKGDCARGRSMPGIRETMNAVVHGIESSEPLDGVAQPLAGWIQQTTSPDRIKSALSGSWLGHQLHPVLTDLPIGAWTMASTLDLVSGSKNADAARHLVGIGIIA